MSNRSRGNTWELRIKRYLESLGFTVDKARASLKWTPRGMVSGPNDFLGFADLIAVHPEKPYTLFVQATVSSSDVSRRKAKGEAVPWNFTAHRVQLWSRADGIRGGVRMLSYRREGDDLKNCWREFIFRAVDSEWPISEIL